MYLFRLPRPRRGLVIFIFAYVEDSILRRELDVGRNGEFDDGDGSSTEPNDMIEDQLLEDYFN